MSHYDGGRLVHDTPRWPWQRSLTDDERNVMADLAGEDKCGSTITTTHTTWECVLDVDHDGDHESLPDGTGWCFQWAEDERDPDEIRDSWEPDTIKEMEG